MRFKLGQKIIDIIRGKNPDSFLTPKQELKKNIIKTKKLKVIVGAGPCSYENWISTDINVFDITNEADWKYYFKANSISNILAEHVIEHIDYEQAKKALALAYEYLKKGGVFRIAVPDGNNASPYIRELTKPNGLEEGADDHKVFWTIEMLTQVAKNAGFEVNGLEYFDENGYVHLNEWNDDNGYIIRSAKKYKSGFSKDKDALERLFVGMKPEHVEQFKKYDLGYVSLLVDLIKKN